MTLPNGFRASGVAAGLKPSGRLDVGLLVSELPAAAVGVFTTNRVQAAPIAVTKRHVRRGIARAIVVNAGNANACTGSQGIKDARAMAKEAAGLLKTKEQQILVASTGVIGVPMDMSKTRAGIAAAAAALNPGGLDELSAAIMTTDTRPKTASAKLPRGSLIGVAKGAGMIAPEMATMLCFLATDAPADRGVLAQALQRATAGSFNLISVDGCRSTNDCVLFLANGAAGGDPITAEHAEVHAFETGVAEVCRSLARQIVEDGEGATKVVAVTVKGAVNDREAKEAALRIADSVLLRCALHGADPNWGRVLAALGTTRIPFDPNVVDVWLGGEQLAKAGIAGPGDRDKARAALLEREVEVVVDMNRGDVSTTVLTNDLSPEYIRINAEYTT
ncbi:MAG: bifunctional glutamate N-acetyltransferase/amino-acid acetyltransferase ArgJ [Actinomycetota bacterium]